MTVTTANNARDAEARDANENIFPEQRNEPRRTNNDPRANKQQQTKRDRRDVHGWIVLDKPIGMTSTQAVAVVKRLFNAKRAGHAGTLDPLASGVSATASPSAGARSATPTTPRAAWSKPATSGRRRRPFRRSSPDSPA
jgi:hypothetical protein